MKFTILLACIFMLPATDFAQQNLPVKKWIVNGIESPDSNPANEDLAKQISILEIKKATGNNTYSGMVQYNILSKITEPCTIKITGNNISIVTNKQSWAGEIYEITADRMKYKLGTLVYNFRLQPVRNRTRQTPAKFTVNQFLGSWIETMRSDNRNNRTVISNNDTLYIRVYNKDSAFYLPGTAFLPMYGNIGISQGDNLNIATVDYKVISLTDQVMVLDDYNNGIHTLNRTTGPFSFEKKKAMPVAEIDFSPLSMIKSWFVYRIKPELAAQKDDAISKLNIIEKNSDSSFSGNIEFGNWITKNFKTLPCNITITGNNLNILTAGYAWNGQVTKSNGDTLVFGKQNEWMYYLKKNEAIPQPVINTGTFVIDLRPGSLMKNWNIIRSEANPGFITPDIGILRELNIMKQLDSMKYSGRVIFDRLGERKKQDCTIDFIGNLNTGSWATITTAGYSWKIEIFNADGKEMIMGKKSDGIRYYFSQF